MVWIQQHETFHTLNHNSGSKAPFYLKSNQLGCDPPSSLLLLSSLSPAGSTPWLRLTVSPNPLQATLQRVPLCLERLPTTLHAPHVACLVFPVRLCHVQPSHTSDTITSPDNYIFNYDCLSNQYIPHSLSSRKAEFPIESLHLQDRAESPSTQ